MAVDTAAVKVDLGHTLDALHSPGVGVPTETITALAEQLLEQGQTLDAGQSEASSVVAGTDRLLTVTGPAGTGTGKTTMLTVARAIFVWGRSGDRFQPPGLPESGSRLFSSVFHFALGRLDFLEL